MKYITLFIVSTLFLVSSVYALTLNDFPEKFTLDYGFKTVVGVRAAFIDTQSAMNLLKYLGASKDTESGIPTIQIGALKTDDQTLIGNENYIVIGGPCANQLANELLGRPETCVQGFEDGKAIIQLFKTGDKQALLIAGYSGEDTKRAVDFMTNKNPPLKEKIVIDTLSLEVLK